MPLPDFIIGGAQKSGTTTLIRQLRKHPQIYAPKDELHFFSSVEEDEKGALEHGIQWYKKQFPDNGLVKGEKTPNYLFNQNVPKRIHKIVPDVKLIFILRDPVQRAYSQYWMQYRNKGYIENATFEDAIRRQNCEYIERGIYWEQLKRYKYLFDDEQIQIFILKELKNNPYSVYERIYNFLDVKTVYPEDIHRRYYRGGKPRFNWLGTIRHTVTTSANKTDSIAIEKMLWKIAYAINAVNIKGQFAEYISGKQKKGYPPMKKETAHHLYNIFRPHNIKLKEMYPNLPIDHWFKNDTS